MLEKLRSKKEIVQSEFAPTVLFGALSSAVCIIREAVKYYIAVFFCYGGTPRNSAKNSYFWYKNSIFSPLSLFFALFRAKFLVVFP